MTQHEYESLTPGQHVVALATVVESDAAPNPSATRGQPGWVHAGPGDEGIVIDREAVPPPVSAHEFAALITVRFARSGSATLVGPHEIRPA